jgi:hypothetical protein
MLNIALSNGDLQGDMVPTPASPIAEGGGKPSVTLKLGNSLYSPSGAFRLTSSIPGGVVVQCVNDTTLPGQWVNGAPINPDWVTIWTAGETAGQAISEIDMQADGNFVVYVGHTPVYNSQTDQNNYTNGAFIRMQDDGDLVLFLNGQPIWNTGTNARAGGVLVQG